MLPRLALVPGEPAGIGPELCVRLAHRGVAAELLAYADPDTLLAAAAAIGKETLDLAGYGDPSWKDLAWDGVGMVAGLAVAWGVDLIARGVSEKHPLILAPRITPQTVALELRWAF